MNPRATVNIERLRDIIQYKVERGEVTWSHIAREMDWMMPNTQRVKQTIGLTPAHSQGTSYRQSRVTPSMAERLCRAANVDPVDAGV